MCLSLHLFPYSCTLCQGRPLNNALLVTVQNKAFRGKYIILQIVLQPELCWERLILRIPDTDTVTKLVGVVLAPDRLQ